ncbi:ketopantoate reductase family protein [Trinickia caryophylli]|uniref:2-dehydropantoate 2-reductase n=1 Tax=Trinickia caryophylli TaxID=28094 RepID=A0A1X7EP00_TRICW|nr:ketopantoate reductase family protein [Trinickia caryophylli]PMS10249.1 ketopantoate reductase family protein [Trinickia caryophylli]TRX18719.1 ketopantoate reductase family protein [Trinickia caryophylli]WQE10485.1 ketopantoate reductase family protein [Trinickia caryophylli]SMF37409.1 ketopantoate reductase [Trinickia caryophylli]GLU32837.1 2-dehydropantoate 2-reductase [Trinickia caryophylli]
MRFAVLGAGAVGCYFGGMLALHGHDVAFIGRPSHVDAMRHGGLRLQTRAFDKRVAVSASIDIDAAASADVVFVCVKSIDTAQAARQLRHVLAPQAIVVSLQNGVDNAALLRAEISQPVICAAVYVASEMASPGHLLHHGRGDLAIEASPHSESLAQVLRAAGIPTEISDDVRATLWQKFTLNCAYNAVSAIVQLPLGEMPHRDALRATMREVVTECVAVAAAEGIRFADEPARIVERIEATIPAGQYSSTAQDLARGKWSEIDYLNGAVVRRGLAAGIGTPVNQTLHLLVKMLEAKHARDRPASGARLAP